MTDDFIRTHLDNNPWLREPYERLKQQESKGLMHLNEGVDDAGLSFLCKDLSKVYERLPDTYLGFLRFANGFVTKTGLEDYDCYTGTAKYANRVLGGPLIDGKVNIYGTARLSMNGYRHGMNKDVLPLGTSGLGTYYYYYCPDNSYHISLRGGGNMQFSDCIEMLHHMISTTGEPADAGKPVGADAEESGADTIQADAESKEGSKIVFNDSNWIVLEIRDGKALILSDMLLPCRPFNEGISNAWTTSTIRSYLNGEYYNSIKAEDRERIVETSIITEPNPWYQAKGSSPAKDKVFLLSLDEVVRYFGDSGDLAIRRDWKWWRDEPKHDYLFLAQGEGHYIHDHYNAKRIAFHDFIHTVPPLGACSWWLRTPGMDTQYADYTMNTVIVTSTGLINVAGSGVSGGGIYVRPAMWVEL